MYNLGERFGTFVIAAALLFAAMRIHRSTGKHTKITKQIGLVLAFLAGCAFLVTFVGAWMAGLAGAMGAFFVAGLIACAAIIAVDWLLDGKPDRPAFWAAFMLAAFIVFGVAALPRATGQIGNGANQVGTQISRIGR
jgi:asparagine N-glycosylation enzyme membrane subunit Stt3